MSGPDGLDPAGVLGLGSGADSATIRAAWRRQARLCHPDLGGDAEAFRRARRSFELLRSRVGGTDVGERPTLVAHLGPGGVAVRWWRRRRLRTQQPRVS